MRRLSPSLWRKGPYMELTHWMFVIGGFALAGMAQWLLLAPASRDAQRMRDQIAEQVTQSAALVQECASDALPRA
jgi:hypothetical protein